jgi:hypothetical protein
MNRFLLGIGILGAAAVLGGCPIYGGSNEYQVCSGPGPGCYSCPDPSYSGACISMQCNTNSDCGVGYECNSDNQCVQAPTSDGGVNDCSVNGCPDGYTCTLAGGVASCVASPEAGTTHDSGPPSFDGGIPIESGTSEASAYTGPCNADTDCHGGGEKCVDGICTAQVNLCSDGTQCVVAGSSCVDGICEPTCTASNPCPSGYGCDFTRGVCNLDPGGCTGVGMTECQGGATCVDTHCVPPCEADGGSCADGQVCVNGGCIPNQAATFACANDGDQGQLANSCNEGYTCLHHDCYAACSDDGGDSCGLAFSTSTCKDVTIETGTYAVCAPPGTLGSDCDPAQGKYCSGSSVCINGSCM